MKDTPRISALLADAVPFNEIPEKELERYSKDCLLREFAARTVIFWEEDVGQSGYYVLSGRVSLRKSSPNGKELTVALLHRPDPFAILAVIDKRPLPLTAVANTRCEVVEVPLVILSDVMSRYPFAARRLLDVVGNRLRASQELARALAHDRVEIRLAAALLMVADRVEDESPLISISRRELADLTGITIETAVRSCKALEREGYITLRPHGEIQINSRKELLRFTESS